MSMSRRFSEDLVHKIETLDASSETLPWPYFAVKKASSKLFRLFTRAALEGESKIVGAFNSCELWDKERWIGADGGYDPAMRKVLKSGIRGASGCGNSESGIRW
jgi:hypothetical protein